MDHHSIQPEYGMLFQVTGHTRSENLWPASTTPSDLPAILVNTSPATPEQIACPPGSDSPEIPGEIPTKHFQQSFEALEDLERTPHGPRLQMKRAGNVSKALLEDLRGHFTSKGSNIGKVFGYGYLYSREDNEDFVREIVSTALLTVAQKQGIRKALSSLLTDEVHEKYVDSMRVADWVQLYVKLSTKLPDRAWQTVLNFLNIGRSGVSMSSLYNFRHVRCNC